MNLLHIDSSILGDHSVSRQLSAAIVARLKTLHPDIVETYRDLAAHPVPHLSGATIMAAQNPTGDHGEATRADVALSGAVMGEFLAADVIVIGAGLYNFTVPSQLKAWIDRLIIAGVTFRYGPEGRPEGLVHGKRMILGFARGGFYSAGSPIQSFEHGESLLRNTFNFVGITNLQVFIAEGVGLGPEARQKALQDAEQAIAALTA